MASLRIPVGPDDHAQGKVDAPITLVEYGDYQCSHCGLAYPIVKAVQGHFGNELRFVFRNFPLREAHPWAEAAAEARSSLQRSGNSGQCMICCLRTKTGLRRRYS
jgi:protein-disulfide isomerase